MGLETSNLRWHPSVGLIALTAAIGAPGGGVNVILQFSGTVTAADWDLTWVTSSDGGIHPLTLVQGSGTSLVATFFEDQVPAVDSITVDPAPSGVAHPTTLLMT